jgi:ribosome maturation protein Sdo1
MKASKKEKVTLRAHGPILRTISRSRKARRKQILQTAPKTLFTAIKVLTKLLIKGGLQLSDTHRKKLSSKSRNIIRRIHAAKDTKKSVLQNGEGFAGILKVVLPILRTIIGI